MSDNDCWTWASAHASDIPTNACDQMVSEVLRDNANHTDPKQPARRHIKYVIRLPYKDEAGAKKIHDHPMKRNNTPAPVFIESYEIPYILFNESCAAPASLETAAVSPVMNERIKKCHIFRGIDQFKGSLGDSDGCGNKITPFLFFFTGLPLDDESKDESSAELKMFVVPGTKSSS